MMKKKLLLPTVLAVMLLLAIGLSGCNSAKQELSVPPTEKALTEATPNTANKDTSNKELFKPDERKVIQTATILLTSTSLKTTEEKVLVIINDHQGRADEINVTHDDSTGQNVGIYTLRVPQEQLLLIMDSIIKLPEVSLQQRKATSLDVTDEYIDINARLENMQYQEKRLRELLSKANSIDETLKAENELVRVRTQIDSATGRIKKLSSLMTLSTIKLTVTENNVTEKNNFLHKVITSCQESFKLAGDVILGLIMFIVGFSPLLILLCIAYFIYRRIKTRKKDHP